MNDEIFKIIPPEYPKGAYITKPQVSENNVLLNWVCYRRGKNNNGYTSEFEKDIIHNNWDKFAKKWKIPNREEIEMNRFQKWNPKKIKIPDTSKDQDNIENIYKKWAYIAIQKQNKDFDREKTESIIHEKIYTPEMYQEIIKIRYEIAKEILTSDIFDITNQGNYLGPNISEIRNQCEQYIDSGVLLMYKFINELSIKQQQKFLFEWETHLIDKVIKRLNNWNFICETLQIPEAIKEFFEFIEITSSWKNLSPALQSMFKNAITKSKT